jgi:uncharacterized protein YxjI
MLTKNTFFIKEQVAAVKLTDTYDIYDPETGNQLGVAKENVGGFVKWSRVFMKKAHFPTTFNVFETGKDKPIFTIKKPFSLFTSKFTIFDKDDKSIGYFKTKIIEINRGFLVYDEKDQLVAQVKGDLLSGTNFKFLDVNKKEIGIVTKKWSGLGKELFTTADNYVVNITDPGKNKEKNRALMLAAGLAIDIIYFEN